MKFQGGLGLDAYYLAMGDRVLRLDEVPLGVQPMVRDQLMCRYCGKLVRQLANHLRHGHGADPAEYRREFQLLAGQPLIAPDLRESLVERGRRLFATNENTRRGFKVASEVMDERRRKGREVISDAADRKAAQALKREQGTVVAASSRKRSERVQRKRDELAQSLGHQDFAALLVATLHLLKADAAVILGCAPSTVGVLRHQHGLHQRGPHSEMSQRPMRRAELMESWVRGTQPVDDAGRFQCLECAGWYRQLPAHLSHSHRVSQEAYRHRYGLPFDHRLAP